jgi:hypothetical protein
LKIAFESYKKKPELDKKRIENVIILTTLAISLKYYQCFKIKEINLFLSRFKSLFLFSLNEPLICQLAPLYYGLTALFNKLNNISVILPLIYAGLCWTLFFLRAEYPFSTIIYSARVQTLPASNSIEAKELAIEKHYSNHVVNLAIRK